MIVGKTMDYHEKRKEEEFARIPELKRMEINSYDRQLICNDIDHQPRRKEDSLLLFSWSAKKVFVECRVQSANEQADRQCAI